MDTILLPLDGAPLSQRALPLAATLAHALGLRLRLLHVREPQVALENERQSQAAFQGAKWHVRQLYGFEPEEVTRSGYAARVIAEEAARSEVWATVMASHSREALMRTVLGSVAEQVVDASPKPVFLVAASVDAPGLPGFKRILLPLDGSRQAEAISQPVRAFARQLGAEIVVLRVFEPATAEHRARREQVAEIGELVDGVTAQELAAVHPRERRWPKTVERIEFGEPRKEIAEACSREHIDLVAFATHGRTPLGEDRMSRVAEVVLRHSRLPLMVFGREALQHLTSKPGASTADSTRSLKHSGVGGLTT